MMRKPMHRHNSKSEVIRKPTRGHWFIVVVLFLTLLVFRSNTSWAGGSEAVVNVADKIVAEKIVKDVPWDEIPATSYESPTKMAKELRSEMPTGTLLLGQGDCLAVRIFTRSSFTHVATVVRQGTKSWVYDSMNGVGVRKMLLADYLNDQRETIINVIVPKKAWSKRKREAFVDHLESQLGRPYGIKHHLTGKRAQGIHCSEYMTDALMEADVITAKKPSRVSPGSLVEGVIFGRLYEPRCVASIKIQPVVDEQPTGGWFRRTWIGTKRCTLGCCRKMSGWFGCK